MLSRSAVHLEESSHRHLENCRLACPRGGADDNMVVTIRHHVGNLALELVQRVELDKVELNKPFVWDGVKFKKKDWQMALSSGFPLGLQFSRPFCRRPLTTPSISSFRR